MKKNLTILVTLLALGAMLAGVLSTGAWFTSTFTSDAHYVSSGNLDLAVTGGPFRVEKLEPGGAYTTAGMFCVENIGDFDMKWRGAIVDLNDPAGLAPYLKVRSVMRMGNSSGNYGPFDNYENWTDKAFTDLVGWNSLIILQEPVEAFEPAHKACYEIQVKLDSSAPNTVKNAALTAKLRVDGTQWINTGWEQ